MCIVLQGEREVMNHILREDNSRCRFMKFGIVVHIKYHLHSLGCVCFGFKSLSEMLFRKCGCLVAHGK